VPPELARGKTPLHALQDAELVDRARDEQLLAFQVLVERHQFALRAWLRRISFHQDVVDDIAQEVFLKIWRNLGRWDRRGSFRSWMFGIANHSAADARRSKHRALTRDTVWVAENQTPATSPAATMDAALDVERVLSGLQLEQRKVVALCYGVGLSHQEAADALGLPLGTVKSHVSRGRERALALLGDRIK
jgi:RNA polymerase sigma factor (sigma-70 family)